MTALDAAPDASTPLAEGARAWASRYGWAAALFAALLIALATVVFSAGESDSSRLTDLGWSPSPNATAWRPIETIGALDRAVWVRARFRLSEEEAARGAAALVLSGLFSAEAIVNGTPVGGKGRPAISAAEELPGPIDAALPIGQAAKAGDNELLMLVSAHRAGYRPAEIFHAVAIAPSGAPPRRPLTHYAAAVAQVSVLLLIAAAFLASGVLRPHRQALIWAGASALFLLAAMAAETLRAWWSYPYSWHFARLLAVWLALTGFGASLFAAAAARWSRRAPWRVLAIAIVAIAACVTLQNGVDKWSMASLGAFAAAAVWVAWPEAMRGYGGARILCGVFAVLILLGLLAPAQLLDNSVYVLGVLLLVPFALGETRSADHAAPPMLVCDDGAIAAEHVVTVRAAGNYLEITQTNGAMTMLRGSLSRLALAAPLMRVHRSYAVNLEHAKRLVARTGSRYEIELANSALIPVSRRMASEIRGRLNCAASKG